jgi:hypothetical protein
MPGAEISGLNIDHSSNHMPVALRCQSHPALAARMEAFRVFGYIRKLAVLRGMGFSALFQDLEPVS